jgi:chorismate mutase/prephenate dehydratase
MNIQEHRQAIDQLDTQIIQLLNDRTRHVLQIGEMKLRAGEEMYQSHREQRVLQRIIRHNPGPITAASLRAIYREIMSSALSLQKSLAIAYLGPEATFTHQAAIRRFGSSLHYAPQKTIADVFQEVTRGQADYGVVPVENSTEGVVTHTLDMFVDSDLQIVAQIVMPIQHCLVAHGRRAQIRRLYTHPQAIAQCRQWIQTHLPNAEILEASSTTRAAELASKTQTAAAIASALAADRYSLRILHLDIQDNPNNATRFLVLGRQCSPPTGHDRTSLMLSLNDKPGALHQALAPFRRYRINMTKIESRPNKRRAWEYYFFVDCDGHMNDRKLARAFERLKQECNSFKILGSYPDTE